MVRKGGVVALALVGTLSACGSQGGGGGGGSVIATQPGQTACGTAVPCASGRSYQPCTVGGPSGSCVKANFTTNEGIVFECNGCGDCKAAQMKADAWCQSATPPPAPADMAVRSYLHCAALIHCINPCGTDSSCQQGCKSMSSPSSVALFDALESCVKSECQSICLNSTLQNCQDCNNDAQSTGAQCVETLHCGICYAQFTNCQSD